MNIKELNVTKEKIISVLSTPKSLTQLIHLTKIPERTLRYNLVKLKSQNLVKEIIVFSDMRKKLFSLNGVKNG